MCHAPECQGSALAGSALMMRVRKTRRGGISAVPRSTPRANGAKGCQPGATPRGRDLSFEFALKGLRIPAPLLRLTLIPELSRNVLGNGLRRAELQLGRIPRFGLGLQPLKLCGIDPHPKACLPLHIIESVCL